MAIRPSFTTFEVISREELFLLDTVVSEWEHRCEHLNVARSRREERGNNLGFLSSFYWYIESISKYNYRIFAAVDDDLGSFQAVAVVSERLLDAVEVEVLLSSPRNYPFNKNNPHKIRGAATAILCHLGKLYSTVKLFPINQEVLKFYEHLHFHSDFTQRTKSNIPLQFVDGTEFCTRHHKEHTHLERGAV